jgi:uncharacterized cupin superfamily protein
MTHPIVNVASVPETGSVTGHFGGFDRILTPTMRERGGKLGVVQTRVPPGTTACPFHSHLREDEVFFVLSGRGVLRYGDAVHELTPGDCVSCPAGTGIAHQIANPYGADLVYLAIGPHDPHEVCEYPDSGKVLVRGLAARGLGTVGRFERTDYMAGEPTVPKILSMARTTRA